MKSLNIERLKRNSVPNLLFKDAVSERLLVAITGPPGSGKSLLASTIARKAVEKGFKVYAIVAPGQEKQYHWAHFVAHAMNMDGIVDLALKAYSDRDSFIVVDPVNSYYRSDPSRLRKHLSMVLALQRIRGGVAVGVYSETAKPPTPGGTAIIGYSNVFALTWRGRTGSYRVEIVKPFNAIASFRLKKNGDLEWL